MRADPIHLFVELFTLSGFIGCFFHAVHYRRALGTWFFVAASMMGFIRENFVVLHDYLYGFAPFLMMAGKAPLISAIVWGYSIYLSICWAEQVASETLAERNSWLFDALTCLFMVILAIFYEPFLKLIGLARWQTGTIKVMDIPVIAFIGYPSMTLVFLAAWRWAIAKYKTNKSRFVALLLLVPAVSVLHVVVLQYLKNWLGW